MSTTITASDFVDELTNDATEWSSLCDEMVWSDGYSTRLTLEYAEREAARNGYQIADPENLEDELYNAYKCTEKGLS